MRLLFLSSWFPYPPDNGARIRAFNLIKHLSTHHQITLISFARDDRVRQHIAAMRPYCRVVATVPFPLPRPHGLRSVAGLFSTKPRVLADTFSTQMSDLVTRTLKRQQFDAIVASEAGIGTCVAPYVRGIRGIPRVIEDLELSMIKSQIEAQRTWLRKTRRQLTWWKMRPYAAGLLQDLDGCTVVSELERKTVMDIVPNYRSLEVVPNGVSQSYFRGNFGAPQPNTLVFQGALTYAANFEAMDFFLRHVFPLIRAQQPETKLYITGRTDGVSVERLPLGDGVVLTGYLEDVRSTVARSAVCVVPLTLGGGTRLMILEAMALGRPVVSTTKGAEGLKVSPGENILTADGPAEFADAVLRLLADQELQAKLGAKGQRLVREQYCWDGIAGRLDRLLCEVLRQHKHRV